MLGFWLVFHIKGKHRRLVSRVVSQVSKESIYFQDWKALGFSIRNGSVHLRREEQRRRVEREAVRGRSRGLCSFFLRAPEEARPGRSLFWQLRWRPELLLSRHSFLSCLPGLSSIPTSLISSMLSCFYIGFD